LRDPGNRLVQYTQAAPSAAAKRNRQLQERALSQSDKTALVRTATGFVQELKEVGVPLTFKREDPQKLDAIGGWWISLATWRIGPSLGMTVDHCLGLGKPSVWVGFWAPTRQRAKIDRLEEGLPDELRSKTSLVDADFSQGRRWRLTKRLSKRSLREPVLEHYEKYDSYFGLYDADGPAEFDVMRAAGFVRDVMFASDRSLGDKRSASPAKKSHMRYVKRFEVEISPLHDRLQKKFEDFLEASGKEGIISNLGGVDLRYNEAGEPVLCEVKPCTADTSRFAIRTAMGQLLDYRQKLPGAHMQIVLSEKPVRVDAELALSSGFSLALPSGRSFHIERT
jgi:hypothetical protein